MQTMICYTHNSVGGSYAAGWEEEDCRDPHPTHRHGQSHQDPGPGGGGVGGGYPLKLALFPIIPVSKVNICPPQVGGDVLISLISVLIIFFEIPTRLWRVSFAEDFCKMYVKSDDKTVIQ